MVNYDFEKDEQKLELTKLNEKAENAVTIATAAAIATGAAPIPFADAPALIAEQVTLMATICGIYGINIGKDGLKMLAFAVIGTGGATIVGKTIVASVLKLVPGLGSLAGGMLSAGTAGIVTYAMGMSFINICKMVKMGKLSEADLTTDKVKNMMKKDFKKFAEEKKMKEK